jgi:hypothetical protein
VFLKVWHCCLTLQAPSDHHVEVIPDAGHFVFLEQPQLFNAGRFTSFVVIVVWCVLLGFWQGA